MSKLELKTWTIGTSLKSYYDKIVDWLEIDNFYSKIKKNNKLIWKQIDNNEPNKQYSLFFDFDSKNASYKNKSNSTIEQFLKVAIYFNILIKINKNEYELTPDFIECVVQKNNSNKNNVKLFLNDFLLKQINNKFETLTEIIKTYDKNVNEALRENQIKGINCVEDSNISFSFLVKLNKLFKKNKKDEEQINKDIKLIKSEFKSIRNSKDNKDDYFGPILEEIASEYSKDDLLNSIKNSFYSIVNWIKRIKDLPNERITTILNEEILKNNFSIENNSQEDYQNSKCQGNNKLNDEIYSIHLTIFSLLNDYFENVIIPIFQRKYVWNKELIENLVDCLFNNDEKEYSYLNNIIVTKQDCISAKTNIVIVDGQQRTFTILLILFCLFKLYCHQFLSKEEPIKINDKNWLLLFNLFIERKYLSIYSNIDENFESNNIYSFINKTIKNNLKIETNDKNNDFVKKLIIIFNKLENLETKELTNKIDYVLNKSIITYTIVKTNKPEILFKNLNLNSKPLNSLDLFKNYLYSLDPKNPNNEENIKIFNDEFYEALSNTKNQIKEGEVENFAYVINKVDSQYQMDNEKNLNKNVNNFQLLEKWFNNELNNNSKNLKQTFNKLINYLYMYKYLKNPKDFFNSYNLNNKAKKKKDSKYAKALIQNEIFSRSAFAEQVYAAIQENTIFIPLVWVIFNKLNIWHNERPMRDLDLNNTFNLLREIERFNFVWKTIAFEGQSLTKSISRIIDEIKKNDEIENPDELREQLIDLVPELKRFKNNPSDIDKKINDKLNECIKYPKSKLMKPKMKSLLLSRIHFLLSCGEYNQNRLSIGEKQINLNFDSIYSIFIDSKYEYEHIIAQNDAGINALRGESKDEAKKYIDMIGNGFQIHEKINKKASNKNLIDKFKEYKKLNLESNISFSGKGSYLINLESWVDFNDKDEKNTNKNQINLEEYYPKILARTRQILKIIFDIYKYDSKSNFIEDKEENKEN